MFTNLSGKTSKRNHAPDNSESRHVDRRVRLVNLLSFLGHFLNVARFVS